MSKKKRKTSNASEHEGSSSIDKRAAKKAAVLGAEKKKIPLYIPIIIMVVFAVALGGAIIYKTNAAKTSSPVTAANISETANQAGYSESNGIITHPEVNFMDGVAKFYQHQHEGLTIKYFILKSSDGVVRAAFDACDVCWPAGKGYYQDGDHMVCRNCGRRFASIKVNEVKGGCNPAPLERAVEDGQVVIKIEDLLKGKGYFDFSQHTRT